MNKFLAAAMVFVVAFGASTRVFGIDTEFYEGQEDPAFTTVDHYEANCD